MTMNSASKVGDIFLAAGTAFNKLADLTLQLHSTPDSPSGNKWTDEDIEMLRQTVRKFGDELVVISDRIKDRTISQIKSNLKKKAFEDAGLPIQQQAVPTQQIVQVVQQQQQQQQQVVQAPQRVVQQVTQVPVPVSAQQQLLSGSHKSAEVTLNMLNAHHESEVDVEGLPEEVKLQFDTSAQQVAN